MADLSPLALQFRRFRANRLAMFSVTVLTLIVLACFFGPYAFPFTGEDADFYYISAPRSTGFGYDHREAVKVDGWGGAEQADIRAGIDALIYEGLAQQGKIAVVGNSYGGFSSWFAITRHADLVDAAIPMCGMYRLDIDYHATEMPHGRAYSEEMMGGTPEQVPQKYANASPGNFISQIKGALMIVHGLADSNVGPENTHTAVRELTAAGIPFDLLLFENEGHGVFRRSNVETYLAAMAEFLARAFGGKK